jgi:hypothetical protein
MNESQLQPEYAVLFKGVPWASSAESVVLGPGASLGAVTEEFDAPFPSRSERVDDPCWPYDALAWLGPPVDDLHFFIEPTSTVSALVDLVVIMTGSPLFGCRVIPFNGKLQHGHATQLDFFRGGQTEFLWNSTVFNNPVLEDIRAGWETLATIRRVNGPLGRFSEARLFFQDAWRSPHLDHVCMNLDLALRTLVGCATSEASDAEVALAVTRLAESLGYGSANDREILLKVFGVRDSVVKMGRANQDEICDLAPPAFQFVTGLFRKILLTEHVALAIDAVDFN